MRVLITGGAGFIGSHLVDSLLTESHQVTIFDDFDASTNLHRALRSARVYGRQLAIRSATTAGARSARATADLGLNAAVRHLLDGVATRAGLKVSFHSSVSDDLPPQIVTCLYRAIHEAVTNVVRHAHATRPDVSMERDREGVVCVITDNGFGIAGGDSEPGGLGLRGIRDRLKGLQGELELQSSTAAGTQLIISIPVTFGEHADGN